MVNRGNIYSDLAIPPGEYLQEVIAELGISKDELARRMNRPAAKLSAIYKGGKSITPETALQLETVTGVPAHIWIGLETEYRLTQARQKQSKDDMQKEIVWITKFCYRELANFGYVEKRTVASEKVLELQKFFGVASLETVCNLSRYQPLCRIGKAEQDKRSPEALTAWLRMGEVAARKITCEAFNKKHLLSLAPRIRSMTQLDPEAFVPELKSLLSKVGIAFVIIPHLPKTYAHGATYWIGKSKAVLMVTIRRSWTDIFWFSLFHELGHILLHESQRIFIESDDDGLNPESLENEADEWAADTLIAKAAYDDFITRKDLVETAIIGFAEKLGIAPGIVVGRLQHDALIDNAQLNNLRTRYKWDDDN
jgi:HTH-type transcriptional regulator/antitoxin HigA